MVGIRLSTVIVRCAIGCMWAIVFLVLLRLSAAGITAVEDKSLSILVWPLMIDAEKIIPFEKATGIKVHISYYETPRELLYKMRITQGQGYDMVIAADHVMQPLIREGLLQRMDVHRLSFYDILHSYMKGRYFDPTNSYSVPYIISVYGLGIDREFFGYDFKDASWELLFEPKDRFRVSMTDVPMAATMLAGIYLFGSPKEVNSEERIQKIEELLIKQKESVQLYTDIRGEDMLATKNCPVVITIASDLWRIKQEYPHLDFMIPKEGGGMVIESFAFSKATARQDDCYKLLEYLYQPEVLQFHISRYGFFPPRPDVDVEQFELFKLTEDDFRKLSFLVGGIPKERVDRAWLKLMTS